MAVNKKQAKDLPRQTIGGVVSDVDVSFRDAGSGAPATVPDVPLYDLFLVKLERLLEQGPQRPEVIEQALGLCPRQAKLWLQRAAEGGRVERLAQPTRFVLRKPAPQLAMF